MEQTVPIAGLLELGLELGDGLTVGLPETHLDLVGPCRLLYTDCGQRQLGDATDAQGPDAVERRQKGGGLVNEADGQARTRV